jgi:hypothetical protein
MPSRNLARPGGGTRIAVLFAQLYAEQFAARCRCIPHTTPAARRPKEGPPAPWRQSSAAARQPADVEPGRAQHRVQRVTRAADEPAAVHAVVALGVTDHRLDGLPAFEPAPLQRGQRLVLAPVDDLHARVVGVHAPVAQVNDRRGWLHTDVLQQRVGLLELLGQRVAVVRVAGEGTRSHHQAQLVRDGQADLDAELVGFRGPALADALHLGCMQRVELVLAVALLRANSLGATQPLDQIRDGQCRRFIPCNVLRN